MDRLPPVTEHDYGAAASSRIVLLEYLHFLPVSGADVRFENCPCMQMANHP